MTAGLLHSWTLDPTEAALMQDRLRERLTLRWEGAPVRSVAGVDVVEKGDLGCAALAVLGYPDLVPLAAASATLRLDFPYIPGLQAFREIPAVLAAWEKLSLKPDLLMVARHGIAHPRGLGMAAHLGLWLHLPTIGVSRSLLYGDHAEVGAHFGDWTELYDPRRPSTVIGAVVRTREGAHPVYVSPGHRIDLAHAVEFVLSCCRGYRLPEPLRRSHQAAAVAEA